MRVLILESSKFWQKHLSDLLTSLGFGHTVHTSAQSGLDDADTYQYDLVLLPYHLSDMTCIEFCEKYCDSNPNRPPILLLTSSQDKEAISKAIAAGVNEVFYKTNLKALSRWLVDFINSDPKDKKFMGKVLLVEDSQSISTVTKAWLETVGHEVNVFDNAEDAWISFQEETYILVLVDIILTGPMTGIGLTRLIRRSEKHQQKHVPILAFSALNDQMKTVELLNAGASDFIAKPFIKEELLVRSKNLVHNYLLIQKVESQAKYLQKLAFRDQLTGLYNRHFLIEAAPKTISLAQSEQSDVSVSVLDLDHFKKINDTHGHQGGDNVLVGVGELLNAIVGEEDIVARFGGEEFIVILNRCPVDEAKHKMEDLRLQIESLKPSGITVTASIGVTTLPCHSKADFEKLIHYADLGAYEAKQTGRNQVVFKTFIDE